MDGLPVPIRLLDPPLHEFLPEGNTEDIVKELIKDTGMTENEELGHQVSLIRKVAVKMFSTTGTTINYKICSMIEIPRAALLIADELAEQAEFFSFKTNDLTRMTFGYSRDDVGKFLPIYPAKGLLQNDPFEIAEQPEFFSFGTNDLTQMTFGYSRDDVGKFLPTYLAKGLLQNDPFEVLDQKRIRSAH